MIRYVKHKEMKRKGKNKMHTKICFSEKTTHDNGTVVHEFLAIDKSTLNKSLVSETDKQCYTGKESYEWNSSQTAEIIAETENEQDVVKKMNETYELSEPETPNLRRIVQEKRKSNENNLNVKSVKKHLKVRFKDSVLDASLSDIATNASSIRNVAMSSINVFRKRTNSVSNGINSTVDPKFLATKKIPNFAEIHKRMYDKLESIVDAKKRLKDRHTSLTTVQTNKLTNFKINSDQRDRLPNKENKNPCKRLGCKIKKREATECILKNNSTRATRNKVQQQNRGILKGVRTNRRFELQMKARNLLL